VLSRDDQWLFSVSFPYFRELSFTSIFDHMRKQLSGRFMCYLHAFRLSVQAFVAVGIHPEEVMVCFDSTESLISMDVSSMAKFMTPAFPVTVKRHSISFALDSSEERRCFRNRHQ
jgi:hypothetical protein